MGFLGILYFILAGFSFRASNCPSDCRAPFVLLRDPSNACHCIYWTMDCRANNLTTEPELSEYIATLPSEVSAISLYHCPMETFPSALLDRNLFLLEIRGSTLENFDVKMDEVYPEMKGIRLIEAQLQRIPRVLLSNPAPALRYLELSRNNITSSSVDQYYYGQWWSLRYVSLAHNPLIAPILRMSSLTLA